MIKSVRDDKNNYLFFRHVIISCQDEDKIRQKYSMSKVLRTLQVQTESFLMILIQTHILCHTFQADREESWAQFCLAMISILNLARDCAEHHFHEISGETYYSFILKMCYFQLIRIYFTYRKESHSFLLPSLSYFAILLHTNLTQASILGTSNPLLGRLVWSIFGCHFANSLYFSKHES